MLYSFMLNTYLNDCNANESGFLQVSFNVIDAIDELFLSIKPDSGKLTYNN